MSLILSGLPIKEKIKQELTSKINEMIVCGLAKPTLTIIQVGDDMSSSTYIKMKKTFGGLIGVEIDHIKFPKASTEIEVLNKIKELNQDKNINGIIVQLPLPIHFDKEKILESINPEKDVDGLHSNNRNRVIPATTRGILTLLDFYNIDLEGKDILVIGRSELVGIPTALALLKRNATVTISHIKTTNLQEKIKNADIIVSATGHPNLITEDLVNENQIILDVGISRQNGVIVGDVDFDLVSQKVKAITPVPGGIGPLTIVSLFVNLLDIMDTWTNK